MYAFDKEKLLKNQNYGRNSRFESSISAWVFHFINNQKQGCYGLPSV